MRPADLDELVGHERVVGPTTALRRAIESDRLGSIILWGPPGCGKTTLARVIAKRTRAAFVPFSAVLSGIKEVRQIMSEAGRRRAGSGTRTLLFIDEIHRFNKAQQDAFLPHVEEGSVALIGATTQNPSFEVIPALLSRSRVYRLERLSDDDLVRVMRRALDDRVRGLGALEVDFPEDLLFALASRCQGDARAALNRLEFIAHAAGGRPITPGLLDEALQDSRPYHDRGGEEHFNLISAFHKSMRNSDPDATLYWLARMLEAGEDPMVIVRRIVRFASEDVGLADSRALALAVDARDALHFIGLPEAELALAQAALYGAMAPKSNAVYRAWKAARQTLADGATDPVPLHLCNAPTGLMKAEGYGRGYEYAHDAPDARTTMDCLPERLRDLRFYEPTDRGDEAELAERLRQWRRRRQA